MCTLETACVQRIVQMPNNSHVSSEGAAQERRQTSKCQVEHVSN